MASAPPATKRARKRSRWPSLPSGCTARGSVEGAFASSTYCSDIRRLMQALGRQRKYFDARFRHAHGMFELRRQRAVTCHGSPAVAQHLHAEAAQIDHGFDGEEHAGLQRDAAAGLAVMHDVGQGVEHLAQAVAAKIANYRAFLL